MATRTAKGDSLADQAYRRIREKIFRGEYPLGAALLRRLLAAELGMSSLPVTDAIKRLEHDGLVESRTRAGASVRIPTAKDIREHFILRKALEVQVARLFAEKASQIERQEILAMAAELDAATEEAQNSSAGAKSGARRRCFIFPFTCASPSAPDARRCARRWREIKYWFSIGCMTWPRTTTCPRCGIPIWR